MLPLTADHIQVRAELPRICNLILTAKLEVEIRDAGYVVAGNNKNIAIRVGKWVEGRLQCKCVSEGGVDVSVVRINIPTILFVRRAGLNPLAKRITGVLKELVS